MGRQKVFTDTDDLMYFFEEYLRECENDGKYANLAGFARKCYCDKSTLLKYKEETHPYFNAMKLIYTFLEDDTINNKMSDNFKKFYMTNTFRSDYQDKVVTDTTATNTNINTNIDAEQERAELIASIKRKLNL